MLARALDALFPPQCLNCEALVPEHGALCLECWRNIPFITDPMCDCCGQPFAYNIAEGAHCGECLKERPPYAKARAVFVYGDQSKQLVTKLKYNDQLYLASIYGAWLAKAGKELVAESDVIIPVPLSWRRFVGRRYNQAALLAGALSKKTGLPVAPDALRRVRHTPPQTGLSRKQRKDNVRGAFQINPRHAATLKGKRALLIDDVLTTGATLSGCTQILLKSGVAAVRALTLARTTN